MMFWQKTLIWKDVYAQYVIEKKCTPDKKESGEVLDWVDDQMQSIG